jgi:sarcosine oxidase, subunit beta
MNKNYDVIVIGAGSVGQPTTYFLAEKGLKVLCIDKNASSGQGQNKAAIGGVRATHSDPAKIKICQQSLDFFSTCKEKYGIDVGWKKGGYCFPAYREKEEKLLKQILIEQKKYNLNINWESADRIKELVPGINPNGLIGGTYSPDDGQISPLIAAETFEYVSKQHGADFIFHCQTTGLIIENDKIKGIKTDKGNYYSDIVVNAAGAYAGDIGKMAGVEIPILPDSHEAGISAPVGEFLDPLVVDLREGTEGKTSNMYFGQNHEKAIIFCYTPLPVISGTDRRSTAEFLPNVAKRLVTIMPRLKNLRIRRVWRGVYPMTPDGFAIVGKSPQIENFYLGVGMCGQGLMLGPGVAQNLASLITTGKPLIDEEIFEDLSPKRDFYAGKGEALK